MSMARWAGFVLSFAGHTITHSAQPVQSSGCHLYGVVAVEIHTLERHVLEGGGRAFEIRDRIDLHANRGMRTDERALVALDAERLIPHRDFGSDIAAFPSRRARWPRAIDRNALTGRRSPWLASITAVTRFTKSGAASGTGDGV
jgi:hypothetical protein